VWQKTTKKTKCDKVWQSVTKCDKNDKNDKKRQKTTKKCEENMKIERKVNHSSVPHSKLTWELFGIGLILRVKQKDNKIQQKSYSTDFIRLGCQILKCVNFHSIFLSFFLSFHGEHTLWVQCLYQMSPLNHKRTTSSLAQPM